jgi:hypothetical protein
MVIEAYGGKSGGVKRTRIEDFENRYAETIYMFHDGDVNRAIERIGDKFDIQGLWGQLLRKNWHDQDAWFCAELMGLASNIYNTESAHKLNAEDFVMSSKRYPFLEQDIADFPDDVEK